MRTPSLRAALGALAVLAASSATAHPRIGHNLRGKTPVMPAASSNLLYFGGPVIPNPRVYAIWWGGAAAVNSSLTAATGGIGAFFEGVLDSLYIDSWAQYGTSLAAQAGTNKGQAGTNQFIGRGNYGGGFSLTAVPAGNVTDAQIQTALETAITNGTLPPNDTNTIYAIFFPKAVTITVDGGGSCSSFGGYHDRSVAKAAAYLVIPDCGDGFLGFTSVTSHELAEATTDLRPTPGSNPDFPQAWNDSMGDEAGDLCETSGGLLPTEGGSFGVQGIWDQRGAKCALTAHAANDFSVALSPHGYKMAPGATATIAVKTALVAGSAQALALSVTAPAGVTATLASNALMTGDSTTLTVSSANALRDGQVVVTAVAGAGPTAWTHTAALLLNAAPVVNDFSLTVAPADQQANQGDVATYQVQTAVTAGAASSIALAIAGLPAGMSAVFDGGFISAGDTSTLSLKTFGRAAGSYDFTVVGTGDATHTANASLEIVVPGSDAGSGSDGGSGADGGTSGDGGTTPGDGGVTGTTSASSGCAQAPLGTLLLPMLALAWMAARRRRIA